MSESPIQLRGKSGGVVFEGTQSPGGGSRPVSVARVVIENADILTLPTTPVEIVATPGLGKMLWPVAALLVCDTAAGVYTTGLGTLGIDYDGTFAAYTLATVLDDAAGSQVTNLLNPTGGSSGDPGAVVVAALGPQEVGVAAGLSTPFFLNGTSNAQDVGGYADKPLLLAATSNSGDYADGDPANTLTVTLLYVEVTL